MTTDVLVKLSDEQWQQVEAILMSDGILNATASPSRNGNRGGVVVVKDPYYILATSPVADDRSRVLKCGETFAVFDHYGDVKPVGMGEEGVYHEGTRFLSCFVLRLFQERPLLLSSTVQEDNVLLTADMTNPDVYSEERLIIPRGTLHLSRSRFLWQGVVYERLCLRNHGLMPVQTSFSFEVRADYADIFEVRGAKRCQRGTLLDPVVEEGQLVLGYQGLDGVVRRTRLKFFPAPTQLAEAEARFEVNLQPQGEANFILTISCESEESPPSYLSYENALALAGSSFQEFKSQTCDIYTSNEQFNDWLKRSFADLHMMTTQTPVGPYPYAGVPWFSTAFGRDGIITALECLWINPELARGVLAFLASTQAQEINAEQDAEPGKILHETRRGEMAALKEIPFGRYYGSVDATPLFVVLAAAYYQRTGDRPFIESIWPNVEKALEWIDTYGDVDRDGFVEYSRRSPEGLVQQGWKDSHDSVFHGDGSIAEGPIALCEVQGYVYQARRGAADLAEALGHAERARTLRLQAETLRNRFEEAFWCEELSTYGLALDGHKRLCRVRTSNAGHCLLSGIAGSDRARRVADTLLHDDSFSGWGIRTVAASEIRYNPISYHNGTIWPHDNAIIAAGLSRYRLTSAALKVLTGLFDASIFMDLHRMPELFCGFLRRPGEGPILYPVACSPQAWSAATVYLLLQAILGLEVRAPQGQVVFSYSLLPSFLEWVQIKNLRVADGTMDLLVRRHTHDVGINVLHREGAAEVVILK